MAAAAAKAMACSALRVIAVAYKTGLQGTGINDASGLVFLGLIGMLDPPGRRQKRRLKSASEREYARLITGDHRIPRLR